MKPSKPTGHTEEALHRIHSLFPASFLTGTCRERMLLIKLQYKPHHNSIQYSSFSDWQAELPGLSICQAFQLLMKAKREKKVGEFISINKNWFH